MSFPADRPASDIFRDFESLATCHSEFYSYLDAAGPDTPVADRMGVTVQLARAEVDIGNAAQAARLLQDCEAYILSHGNDEEKACFYNASAMLCAIQANYSEGIDMALRAVYLFGQLDHPYYTMSSLIVCGHLCMRMCLYAEGIGYMSQARQIAAEKVNAEQAILCSVNLNEMRPEMLPPADCIGHCLDLLAEIEYTGTPALLPESMTYLQLAHLHVTTGDIVQAETYANKSMETGARITWLQPHNLHYINLYSVKAAIAGARNDEAGVIENISEQMARADKANHVPAKIDARFFLFRFYLGRGDTARAKAYLDEGIAMIAGDDKSSLHLSMLEQQTKYYAAMGDRENELLYTRLTYDHKLKEHNEAIIYRTRYASAIYEFEIKKREVQQQKTELDFKTQELNMTTYYLQQRNQLLRELKESLIELRKKTKENAFKALEQKIDHAFSREDSERASFRERFDEINRDFIARLHSRYPTLSGTECRMCALLRSGLNSKEISDLLSTSIRTIENHRQNIRKKMNLLRTDNLNLILSEIK
ncbi:MAG: Two component regulator three domain protein [Bacteroidetes bacterium]|nr:Two component regulator three domain protein [Bacteroidota bacterium]